VLNRQRVAEEAKALYIGSGRIIRFPRFGSATDRPKLDLVGGGVTAEKATDAKPTFPANDLEQNARRPRNARGKCGCA